MLHFCIAALILAHVAAPIRLVAADAVPSLNGYVNDTAAVLSPEAVKSIEAKLMALEQADSTQFAVLTVPDLGGRSIEEFGIAVADRWQLGQKGKDNGVILLLSRDDRKVRIEVGRGLEGVLTDLKSGRIIDDVIIPELRKGDFNAGLEKGVDATISVIRGEYQKSAGERKSKGFNPFIIVYAIITSIVARFRRLAGGVMGAVGLPIIVWLTMAGATFGIILAMIPLGFFLGIISPNINLLALGGRGGGSSMSGGGGRFSGGGASGGW